MFLVYNGFMRKRMSFAVILSTILLSGTFLLFLGTVLAAQEQDSMGIGLAAVHGVGSGISLPSVNFDGGTSKGLGKLDNPVKFDFLKDLIAEILNVIVQIGVPIAALFLIYAGFLFVSARGSEEKLGKAKAIFLWTLVGIAVLLGASVLADVISSTIDQLKR